MLDKMLASEVLHHLAGVETHYKDGSGNRFNWIMSNGDRSKQREKEYPTKYTHMLPEGSHKMIRAVRVYYYYSITGFQFFDKDWALLWTIGNTYQKH